MLSYISCRKIYSIIQVKPDFYDLKAFYGSWYSLQNIKKDLTGIWVLSGAVVEETAPLTFV